MTTLIRHRKSILLCATIQLISLSIFAQQQQWVSTTEAKNWATHTLSPATASQSTANVTVETNSEEQTIDGFGTCFNELGWTSLSLLPDAERESILKELFAPGVGANFTICRMPVGANDFSRKWYSYDESDGDFDMKNFSIGNDLETLVPFIKNAQKYNPSLQLWASPWSPPQWMKYNKHYAGRSVLGNSNFVSEKYGMDMRGINNGLATDKQGKEGTNMFVQDEKYFKAYALYFRKFVEAYKNQHIKISMVMPQNEFNSAQPFPSCTWTAAGLANFASYLGPEMKHDGVKVFFGTDERANPLLADTVLNDPRCKDYIAGVGFQWAGKGAIPVIHQQHPDLKLYQSEQECGNGKNDWEYCVYTWGLMKHYLSNGANAYMYWNTSLKEGGISTWGWKQNSLVVLDTTAKTYRFTHEYYLMKHLSHFVKPGAKKVKTSGDFTDVLAFKNQDGSVAVIAYNETSAPKSIRLNIGRKHFAPELEAGSFNTFLIKN